MPVATPEKAVFIDETPDYKQAMQALEALSQDEKALASITKELGLAGELEKAKDSLNALNPQFQALNDNQKVLLQRAAGVNEKAASITQKTTLMGGAATLAAGGVAGYMGGKRWGVSKGFLAALAATVAAGAISVFSYLQAMKGPKKEADAVNTDAEALNAQQEQVLQKITQIRQQFLAKMATKMLEDQKMLMGEGPQAKLVSTAVAAAELLPKSMASYAAAPTATHADALTQSQQTATWQR